MMKRGARKKMNVAKLHKHGPRGLVCLYAKDEAGVFEQNDLFVVDYDLDERAAGVAREGPMVFMFDIDSGRLCGLFQVVRVEMSVDPNAKISVEVRERYPPLEGAEVLEVARDLGLRLDNHFPEILNSTQVSNLVDVFQRKLQMHQQAYAHPGPMLVDGMYNEAPPPQPQRPRLYPGPQQPSFTENPWADEYDGLNGVDSPIQFDAARGGVMEPPPHAPYAAPAATVESTRGVNLGLGMKPVLCTPPEQYGASYSHPIANHRSVPDPEAAAAAAGYGVSRHPRAAPVVTVVPAAYNNISYSNCADGMYAQRQQQQQPAPLQQLRVPIKAGDDFVKGGVDYGQPGKSRSPLGSSHGVAAEAGYKPVPFREAASSAPAAAATGGKKGSGRKSVFNRIDEMKLFTKSFKKRQEHKQQQQQQQQIADCEPVLREEKSKGRWVQTGKGGGSALTRENKRKSVFNRLDGLEDYETELPMEQQRHLQKQQQQQKLQQLQKQQHLQKHPQQCWQQHKQKQERKVTWDDAQTSGHMINFRRDQNRKKPQKVVVEVVVEEEQEQEPELFVDGEESQPFMDFKRRSLNGSSSKRRENGNCSSDNHHTQQHEQEQPRSKKRRFVRPDGLGTGSAFRSEGVQLGCS